MRNVIQAIGRLKGLRGCGQLIYIILSPRDTLSRL